MAKTTSRALGAIRVRIWAVIVPTPGAYSTMTLARPQSIFPRRRSTRKRELGISEPSILGCCKKFLANRNVSSRREGIGWNILSLYKQQSAEMETELNIIAFHVRCKTILSWLVAAG